MDIIWVYLSWIIFHSSITVHNATTGFRRPVILFAGCFWHLSSSFSLKECRPAVWMQVLGSDSIYLRCTFKARKTLSSLNMGIREESLNPKAKAWWAHRSTLFLMIGYSNFPAPNFVNSKSAKSLGLQLPTCREKHCSPGVAVLQALVLPEHNTFHIVGSVLFRLGPMAAMIWVWFKVVNKLVTFWLSAGHFHWTP